MEIDNHAKGNKIDLEINKSEIKKLKSKNEELQRKRKSRREYIAVFLIAVILTIPASWFYFSHFAEPIMQWEKIKLIEDIVKYEKKLKNLEAKKDSLENEFLELDIEKRKQEVEFQKQLEKIKNEYIELNSLYEAKTQENKKFKVEVDSLHIQIEGKNKLINVLDSKIVQAKLKTKEFKKKVDSLNLQINQKNILIKNLDRKIRQQEFRASSTYLSLADVEATILKYDFYDKQLNPKGKGFPNQFKKKKIRNCNIIIDEATGLMWQQGGSSKQVTFKNAQNYIEELNRTHHTGFSDWRLPTLKETMSLMEPECRKDGCYINDIFENKQRWVWTSDIVKDRPFMAWVVFFFGGSCFDYTKTSNAGAVRAVRSK
ncbi:MAG: DUF1566 domain-containing protein [Candidatus Atribacteria bacterium]|nr:DUF1566 domain-containing protein [Candidatus Atribacteria bacterium]